MHRCHCCKNRQINFPNSFKPKPCHVARLTNASKLRKAHTYVPGYPRAEYLQDLQVTKFIHCKNHKRSKCNQLRRQSEGQVAVAGAGSGCCCSAATQLRLPQSSLNDPLLQLQQLNYNETHTHIEAFNFPTKLFTEFMRREP